MCGSRFSLVGVKYTCECNRCVHVHELSILCRIYWCFVDLVWCLLTLYDLDSGSCRWVFKLLPVLTLSELFRWNAAGALCLPIILIQVEVGSRPQTVKIQAPWESFYIWYDFFCGSWFICLLMFIVVKFLRHWDISCLSDKLKMTHFSVGWYF